MFIRSAALIKQSLDSLTGGLVREGVKKLLCRGHVPYQGGGSTLRPLFELNNINKIFFVEGGGGGGVQRLGDISSIKPSVFLRPLLWNKWPAADPVISRISVCVCGICIPRPQPYNYGSCRKILFERTCPLRVGREDLFAISYLK